MIQKNVVINGGRAALPGPKTTENEVVDNSKKMRVRRKKKIARVTPSLKMHIFILSLSLSCSCINFFILSPFFFCVFPSGLDEISENGESRKETIDVVKKETLHNVSFDSVLNSTHALIFLKIVCVCAFHFWSSFFLVVLNRAGSSLFPFLPVYLDFFIESCI